MGAKSQRRACGMAQGSAKKKEKRHWACRRPRVALAPQSEQMARTSELFYRKEYRQRHHYRSGDRQLKELTQVGKSSTFKKKKKVQSKGKE